LTSSTAEREVSLATVNGINIPDSRLSGEITELVRDVESELLFAHSSRVYYFGALAGQRRGLDVDPELLYAAAMFHDLGLMPEHSSPSDRFEVDGANVARDFLAARGIRPADVDLVWLAVALHTTPGITMHMHPVVALLNAGVRLDVVGVGYDELPDAQREAVVAAYPREPQFEEGIIQAFYDGIKHKPETAYGTINADVLADKDPHYQRVDFCSVIRRSRWRR
jgi:HD superfamily phosphodiesterase